MAQLIPLKGNQSGWDRRPVVAAAALVIFFVILAWDQRFFLDDAFISFRYASNLVHGHGLVWNPNEIPVEGYTNFLWTLIMVVPLLMGIDPVLFSVLLGVLLFGFSLVIQYRLGAQVIGEPWAGPVSVLILGGLYSFRAFASGGLETMLQATLLLLVVWLAVNMSAMEETSRNTLFLLSVLLGLAFLTRMDSALLALAPAAWVILLVRRFNIKGRQAISIMAMAGPFILLAGTWLVFKFLYYGSLLPNTFLVKIPDGFLPSTGFVYVHHFFASYLLYPLLLLLILALLLKPRTVPEIIWIMASICLIWLAYLVRIGGDFMEFRLMVPILPYLSILLVWAAWKLTSSVYLRCALITVILVGSAHHQITHAATSDNNRSESTRQLHLRLQDEGDAWIASGKRLGELFGGDGKEPVTVAVTAAGAIPYYSGLRTVDMLGLNDPWIARNGIIARGNVPGHHRVAPVWYLKDQGVHLLMGHPAIFRADAEPSGYLERAINLMAFMEPENIRQLSPKVRIVEIPVLPSKKLVAVYLKEHQRVNSLIRGGMLWSYEVQLKDPAAEETSRSGVSR